MAAEFSLSENQSVLANTPAVLEALLRPLPQHLLKVDEGPGTWSPLQVVSHLAWGELDDWVPRTRRILEHGASTAFTPFDREAGFTRYAGWSLDRLLEEFSRLRASNLAAIQQMKLGPDQLKLEGRHPELGRVTLEQLLATWVTHDYAHLAQITRVLARYYGGFTGPWRRYFSLLGSQDATPA
jgi:DinB superfamily